MIKSKIIIFIALICCVFFAGCTTTNHNLDNVKLVNNTFTYTGAEITPVFSDIPNNCDVKIYRNGTESIIKDAGTYLIKVIKGKKTKTFELKVNKKQVDILCDNISITYGETYQFQPSTETQIDGEYSFKTTYNSSENLPTNCGTYQIQTTLISSNYYAVKQNTLTINKAECNLSIENSNFTFNGEEININYVTDCNENFTVSENKPTIINAGNYEITAKLESENYYVSKSFNVTVNAKPINITLSENTFTYTGNEIDVLQYAQSETNCLKIETDKPLVNAGRYDIKIVPNSNNYSGILQTTITIQKQAVSLNFCEQTTTFDNTEKNYVTDNNYSYIIKYNNSLTKPVNAGIYTVSIEIQDNNYCGSCETQLIIEKQQVQLTLTNNMFTYSGKEINLEINNYSFTLEIYKDKQSVTNIIDAGTYEVIATVNETNYTGTSTFSVTVLPKTVNIKLNKTNYDYTGNSISLDIYFSEDVNYDINIFRNSTQVTEIKDAGIYNVQITINNSNYTGYFNADIYVDIENLQDKVHYAVTKLMQSSTITATGTAILSYALKDVEFDITKTYTKFDNSFSYYEKYYSNYAYEDSKVFFLYSENDITEYERSNNSNKTFANNITNNRETDVTVLGLLSYQILSNATFEESNNTIRYVLTSQQKTQLGQFYSYLFGGSCEITNAVLTLQFNSNYEFSSIMFDLDYTYNGYEVTEKTQYKTKTQNCVFLFSKLIKI